jgi:hypothetical protein
MQYCVTHVASIFTVDGQTAVKIYFMATGYGLAN